jgi:membrane-bound lytic murein transglycosylase D
VSHFVSLFSGGARDIFTQWVQRGTRYEPLIRGKLRQAGLPEDMAYLPIIESGYSPHAYSSAAAVGMWQLMTSTARGAGLRVDWWVDERRDPVRSTDAAIRFLRYLKDQFGSIYLAAAAYDGGPGRISRGLARYAGDFEGTTGDDLFFALADKKYLRGETKDYVPQLIAAALVAKEPARYGLHIEPMEAYAYDTVRVGPATPLAAIAKASGAPLAAIADLNPFILRGVTPPKDSFTVRVPVGGAAAFGSNFAALSERDRTAFTRVTTRKGDGFGSVAERSGVSVRHLKWYNPGVHALKSGRLPAGEAVLIPSAAVTAAALDVPDPAIERYGTGRGIHIVKSGESLGRIALHYHTTVATLMRLNGLRKSIILPGQALVVSGSATPAHKHRVVHTG